MIQAIGVGELSAGEFAQRLNALRGTAVYAVYLAADDEIEVALTELEEELRGFDPSAGVARISPRGARELVAALADHPVEILLVDARSFSAEDWALLDRRRSSIAHHGLLVFVTAPSSFDELMRRAPNLASWLGGRDRGVSHLMRDDEAWFDFTITVRERAGGLELLAYNFEIRFPSAMGSPFLRFDLNLPEHRNEDRELRSHLHPGSDDVHGPAPMMSPDELIALFVDGLRRPTNREKWRTPTPFEIEWFRTTHDDLAARSR